MLDSLAATVYATTPLAQDVTEIHSTLEAAVASTPSTVLFTWNVISPLPPAASNCLFAESMIISGAGATYSACLTVTLNSNMPYVAVILASRAAPLLASTTKAISPSASRTLKLLTHDWLDFTLTVTPATGFSRLNLMVPNCCSCESSITSSDASSNTGVLGVSFLPSCFTVTSK